MSELKPGDIVCRSSYAADVLFQVVEIAVDQEGQEYALLKGLNMRLFADAPLSDIQKASDACIRDLRKEFIQINNRQMARIVKNRAELKPHLHRSSGLYRNSDGEDRSFAISGRVLHVDGTEEYLRLCEEIYKQLGIEVQGVHVPEKDQPDKIMELLHQYQPDVLVLTGHDGFIKGKKDFADLESYRNSKYFVEAVRRARRYRPNKDDLIIIAGACQSHYEELLKAGANYASSPQRVLIHAFDPVFIVEKIYFTSASGVADVNEVIENTITGISGLGGIETRGKHRFAFPRSPY